VTNSNSPPKMVASLLTTTPDTPLNKKDW
jgi:hypothetical protein